MFCSACGTRLSSAADFCPQCGANARPAIVRVAPARSPSERADDFTKVAGRVALNVFFGVIAFKIIVVILLVAVVLIGWMLVAHL